MACRYLSRAGASKRRSPLGSSMDIAVLATQVNT
jgi:hypothetical protein